MTPLKSSLLSLSLFGLFGLLGSSDLAFAADHPEHPIPQACQADVAKLCPGMTPGDGKLGACVREHHEEFSKECKGAMRAMRQAHRSDHPASGTN